MNFIVVIQIHIVAPLKGRDGVVIGWGDFRVSGHNMSGYTTIGNETHKVVDGITHLGPV
jgi:hypothetical protein